MGGMVEYLTPDQQQFYRKQFLDEKVGANVGITLGRFCGFGHAVSGFDANRNQSHPLLCVLAAKPPSKGDGRQRTFLFKCIDPSNPLNWPNVLTNKRSDNTVPYDWTTAHELYETEDGEEEEDEEDEEEYDFIGEGWKKGWCTHEGKLPENATLLEGINSPKDCMQECVDRHEKDEATTCSWAESGSCRSYNDPNFFKGNTRRGNWCLQLASPVTPDPTILPADLDGGSGKNHIHSQTDSYFVIVNEDGTFVSNGTLLL